MTNINDCFNNAHQTPLLTVEQTLEQIKNAIEPIKSTDKQMIRDALGQTLAENVISDINVPPHRNSAMDGYAINSEILASAEPITLAVVGTAFAGTPFQGKVSVNECVRIMTGAMMPQDCDTVIMQEDAQRSDDLIRISNQHLKAQNVRHPGEDIEKGAVVLHAGKQISPADLGLLSSIGVSEVTTYRKPKIAFFSTGDELKSLGQTLQAGDIYDSNRYTLYGMLKKMDVELLDLGVIADDKTLIKETLENAANSADMILTSGGASVGEADYVSEILQESGKVNFWKIAMKPGKPLAFGSINQTPYFGLPGNPVSVMATCYLFVQPAISRLKGLDDSQQLSLKAKCIHSLKKVAGRTDFQRGILKQTATGELIVDTTGLQGSHILTSMSVANCFIVIPQDSGNVEAGETVEVLPFNGII
ncbi:MAG: molybdopterin molybdotransferase MoeA [Gammaproteobacteria bacterium]|nr:molybdopterin molybdotransferase MoeA [Gammaproteobacteria bacterium]